MIKVFDVSGDAVRTMLPTVFHRCGYQDIDIQDGTRTAMASRTIKHMDYFQSTSKTVAEIRWNPLPENMSKTEITWNVFELSGNTRQPAVGKADQLGRTLREEIDRWVIGKAARKSEALPHNPVVYPGGSAPGAFTGTMRDYSGCATKSEVADLTCGVLPLGQYTFGCDPFCLDRGPALFLSRFHNNGMMEYNGVLVCAPQNGGKTRLVIRWAKAAAGNPEPYSVFIIDVKGNLRKKLINELPGNVYYFSTDPFDDDSDRINFLEGADCLTAAGSDRIRQLVTALLPSRGWTENGGENEFYYRNRVVWLTAFVHLLKLMNMYYPEEFLDDAGNERDADLCDLYDLVASEDLLHDCITRLREGDQKLRERGEDENIPECGVDHWVSELAIMLDPRRFDGGQRPERESYRSFTTGILTALEPFSRHGTLHHRVRSFGTGRLFNLEDVLGNKSEPATVILAARQQDLEKADAILSMAIKRLQWFLFDRMPLSNEEVRPVLLLLDETRRIRDFDAAEYITFAREAKACCIVVYQSLDQIGRSEKITEILENVGAQIYLGSLVGNTARYFIGILPKRWRPVFTEQNTRVGNNITTSITQSREHVDYISTTDLYDLPAGSWPALVYINDRPRRKPILTDLAEKS